MKRKNEFEELKEEFCRYLLANDFSEGSIKRKKPALKYFFNFLVERKIYCVRKITGKIITDYQLYLWNSKGCKNKILSRQEIEIRLRVIQQFFEWLTKAGRIIYNPAEDIEIPKRTAVLPRIAYSQKEIEKVLLLPETDTAIGYRDRTIMELLYSTGMRNSELRKLKLADLNLDERTLLIRQGKGRKDRIAYLTGTAAGYLEEYLEKVRICFTRDKKEDSIFLSHARKPIGIDRLGRLVRKYQAKSGIAKPLTPHIFRSSIATHLLENGMPIRYIQDFLGHEKIDSTQHYAQVTLSDLRKVYNKYHPKEQRISHAHQETS